MKDFYLIWLFRYNKHLIRSTGVMKIVLVIQPIEPTKNNFGKLLNDNEDEIQLKISIR